MLEIDHTINRGLFNELLIIEAINGKKVCHTNLLFQELFYSFFKDIDANDRIKAYKGKPNEKTDVIVKINNQIMNISVKVGVKNSVHVEGIYSFIMFMKELKIPQYILRNTYITIMQMVPQMVVVKIEFLWMSIRKDIQKVLLL